MNKDDNDSSYSQDLYEVVDFWNKSCHIWFGYDPIIQERKMF